MTEEAEADLPVGDDRPAANRIAGLARQRPSDRIAVDGIGAERIGGKRGRRPAYDRCNQADGDQSSQGHDNSSKSARGKGRLGAAPCRQAFLKSWFITGSVRMRLPVAAKMALSTAGAATAIVGSPTPPQKSPDGTITASTFGISSMRMTL